MSCTYYVAACVIIVSLLKNQLFVKKKKNFEKAGLQLHCSIAHARLLQYIQCTIVTHAVHNVG